MTTRQEKILSCIDLRTQQGLEIGALNKPIVTPEMGDIRYVDHASTEELRQKYAADPNVDVEAIVDVSYVWGTQTLPELVGADAPFDYVIASHVIEHVPDLIGWLKEIHAVLKPGGVLALAIPDKRYCFDYLRPLTQPADVIESYLRQSRKPSPQQIFEFVSSVAYLGDEFVWSREVEVNEQNLRRLYSAKQAWDITHKIFSEDSYYDVHCWVFTPDSWIELLKVLIPIGLFDFQVTQFPQPEGCEFYANLIAMDLTKEESERYQLQLESLPIYADQPSIVNELSVKPPLETDQLQQLRANLQHQQSNLTSVRSKLQNTRIRKKKLKKKVADLEAQLATSEQEIAAMQSSKFWKLRGQWMKLKKLLGLEA